MNESTSQLIQAVSSGNVKKLDNLLRQGISPNVRDDQQRSALNWAAVQGHIAIVRMLLLHGANPDKTTPEGWTPLKLAERKGHTAVAYLLSNCSSANSGRRPEVGHLLGDRAALMKMMFNCDDEDIEIIRTLLQRGISPNLDNGYGVTILSGASMRGNSAIVKLLLENGSNPNLGSKSFIALELAAGKGHAQIVEALLAHKADVKAENAEGWTALSSAASNGHMETVEVLLKYGANPTQKGLHNESAIAWAKHKGHQQIVQVLSEAQNPQPAIANLLLNDTMVKAVKANENFTIDLLLTKGADSNSVDADGRSALSWAVGNGNLAAIRSLIAHKADINLKDRNGRNALASAVFRQDDQVLDFLLSKGAKPNILSSGVAEGIEVAPLHLACIAKNIQLVTTLIRHGANPNLPDSVGVTPLHWAADSDEVDTMKFLISKGGDLEAVADSHWTILMGAAYAGAANAIDFLVDIIDDIDKQDDLGNTALIYAVTENHLEAVRALLGAGADVTIGNDDGETAHSTAEANGNKEILRTLELFITAEIILEGMNSSKQEKTERNIAQTDDPQKQPDDLTTLSGKLDSLVGLNKVKADVTQLVNFLHVQKLRKDKGLSVPEQSLHMVFTGNPGTGKTTIARLIAQIYKSMGILSKGQFIETDRAGLVGGYLGQTAIKTQEIVESALGGVLFIDEAYSLTDSTHGHDMYGQEAVATLLKLMEDHRDDLIVIVAGYTEPMQKFIRSNPGLQSRFNKFLHFDDYAPAELTEIFGYFAAQGDYTLHPATELKLHNVFADLYAGRDETFGNARLARNMFEKAINAHANRMVSAGMLDEASLVTLYPEDISSV